MHEEQHQRVAGLHKKAFDLKLAINIDGDSTEDYTSPDFESEAYYEYPLTLDYVIDLAFQNGTDGDMVEYPVIVDTGSSNLAIAVSACTSCDTGATTLDLGWYDPELCIDVTYGSGSWDGMMTALTNVGFVNGPSSLVDAVYMGGITSADSFFEGDFNGILGLAYSALSESYSTCTTSSSSSSGGGRSSGGGGSSSSSQHQSGGGHTTQRSPQRSRQQPMTHRTQSAPHMDSVIAKDSASTSLSSTPLLDSFYADGLVSNQVFSILFCGDDAMMSIGGYDESQVNGSVTFVDTQKTYNMVYGYYLVDVLSVSMAGTTVSDDTSTLDQIGGVLVDSGTTLIYLPSSVTSGIETLVMEEVPAVSKQYFEWATCVTEDVVAKFPTLTIALDGYDLELTGKEYTLWYGGCYYWGMSSSSIPIIGNVALQDKMVVFDKDNNQLGFADGDCSALGGETYGDDTSGLEDEAQSMKNVILAATTFLSEGSRAFVAPLMLAAVAVGIVVSRFRTREGGPYRSLESDDIDCEI
eukprot:CAMPEP_0185745864 /NCGR_PEP_ID=MMETSP1174-20130828/4247_1 /TAXON_ID=35687 /ORGANISM="Dictyocha speculum, Strain CCMP1381" /LENGTH=522 /DNA_ID=CAMNT_0028420121 /DNA_START=176 /DNA_END=1744 /DNA_ORIENTATION=+